ncbi:SU10 major capsid protein, partial [Endozoicomonas atrinae]
HPMFRQIKGLADTMIALDFSYIKYRYLDGRDTQLLKDRQGNDADAVKHEYLTECGVEMLQDKVHSVFKNWQLRA